jgi:hypothetical protein
MKNLILAAFIILTIGGAAFAQSHNHTVPQQSGNNYNFTEGGGG